MQTSIVIPCRNEVNNIIPLIDEIVRHLTDKAEFEIIVVDDGSDDGMQDLLKRSLPYKPMLRVLRHEQSAGQSAAIHSGVLSARFDLICTLDGDGQNPPEELPRLLSPFRNRSALSLGLVAGQRVQRKDSVARRIASRFANKLRMLVLHDRTRDTGCGLKCFRRDAFLALPYFDHMHRYLPALFVRDGWIIEHVDVSHRLRNSGRSHYSNFQRAVVGVFDLMGVAWLLRRRKKTYPLEIHRCEG